MNIISEGEAVVSSRRQTSRLLKMVGRTDAIFVGLGFDACSRSATLDSANSNSEGQLGDNPGWTPVDLVGVAGRPVAPPTPTATLTETATSTSADGHADRNRYPEGH